MPFSLAGQGFKFSIFTVMLQIKQKCVHTIGSIGVTVNGRINDQKATFYNLSPAATNVVQKRDNTIKETAKIFRLFYMIIDEGFPLRHNLPTTAMKGNCSKNIFTWALKYPTDGWFTV